jgi:hypothetical protein
VRSLQQPKARFTFFLLQTKLSLQALRPRALVAHCECLVGFSVPLRRLFTRSIDRSFLLVLIRLASFSRRQRVVTRACWLALISIRFQYLSSRGKGFHFLLLGRVESLFKLKEALWCLSVRRKPGERLARFPFRLSLLVESIVASSEVVQYCKKVERKCC